MKRVSLITASFLIALTLASLLFAWSIKTELFAYFLSRKLNVPVSVGLFELKRELAHMSRLWIGTPSISKTNTSFASQEILINAPLSHYVQDPLIIDEVDISNILVGIEYYNQDGSDNNWHRMLDTPSPSPSVPSRQWLIREITLRNLTVVVTDASGNVKRYPTIQKISFQNVSSDTGFPVDEIEKAIFNLMLQDLIRQLDLNKIIQQLAPNFMPKGVPFPVVVPNK